MLKTLTAGMAQQSSFGHNKEANNGLWLQVQCIGGQLVIMIQY